MSVDPRPPRPGRQAAQARLAEILRVDHAGEVGAVWIYRGQQAVFKAARGGEAISAQLADMEAHEAEHLRTFEAKLREERVRPTALAPVWRIAGFAVGAATALLGQKAAHACTEAVETVIEGHYAGQIQELVGREPALAETLSRFRDDELAHRDQALEQGAREAAGYGLLAGMIRAGCRAAIRISEKV